MRPYITEVSSNIQGGVKAKLGPKTLIIGPNRIGKSSITRAIELACSGRASDVAGRDTLAMDAELFTLAPADAEVVTASVVIGDANGGETAAWTLARGKKAKRSGKTVIFPLRDVRSAILGSAETARKFFLSVAGRVTWEMVLAEIPPQFHARLKPYAGSDGASSLLAAIEGAKKRVREINAEVKAQRATAQTMAQGLPPPPSSAEVAQAKLAADMAAKVVAVAGPRARLALVEAEAQRGASKLEAAQQTADTLEAKLAKLPNVTPLPAIVEHAIAVGEHLVMHNATSCAICGFAQTPDVFKARVEKAKKMIAANLAASQERRLVEEELARSKSEIARFYGEAQRIIAERDSLKAIVGENAILPAVSGDYGTLVATAAKWESVRAAEGRAVELETEAAVVGQLPTLCSTALERLLEKSRTAFEARVQRYMPKGMTFGVDLKDGDRDVFRVGLRHLTRPEGSTPNFSVLRTALSGAEWATVTVALAATVADGAPADQPVVVIPEDRDFDANTLTDVMESFASIDAQVIMAGTKPPTHLPAGWTIVDLGTANDMAWCSTCKTWIAFGPCDHGIGKPAPRANGDLFASR
jgi:hypothetical protein